jgi:hypothetical protein
LEVRAIGARQHALENAFKLAWRGRRPAARAVDLLEGGTDGGFGIALRVHWAARSIQKVVATLAFKDQLL